MDLESKFNYELYLETKFRMLLKYPNVVTQKDANKFTEDYGPIILNKINALFEIICEKGIYDNKYLKYLLPITYGKYIDGFASTAVFVDGLYNIVSNYNLGHLLYDGRGLF